MGEDTDLRFHTDFEGKANEYAGDDKITPEDCLRVGLPPNPAYEHDVLFEGEVSFQMLRWLDEFDVDQGKIDLRKKFPYLMKTFLMRGKSKPSMKAGWKSSTFFLRMPSFALH